MRFRVLGPVTVVTDDKEFVLGSTREAALLADLLVHAGQVVPAGQLIEDVWRNDPPPGAAGTLQTYVRNLRRLLEPNRKAGAPSEVLISCRPGYELRVDPDGLDAWCFDRLLVEGRAAAVGGVATEAVDCLHRALGLWRGPAYGDLAAESYLRGDAVRLEELRLVATEERIEAELTVGRHGELCGQLEQLVVQHPFRERLWGQWILALYRADRQADALRAYQQLRVRLGDELGIEPSDRLRRMEEAILLHKPELEWSDPGTTPTLSVGPGSPMPAAAGSVSSETLTFVISVVDDSGLGRECAADVRTRSLRRLDDIVGDAVAANGGVVFRTTNESFGAVFHDPDRALIAAIEAQRAVRAEPWPDGAAVAARMAVHAGPADERDAVYFGPDVDLAARLAAVADVGQVVMSAAVRALSGASASWLGRHRLDDLAASVEIWQLRLDSDERILPHPTLHQARHNLPVQPTRLLGRDDEIVEVADALRLGPLVTLTGPGGIGKSRLGVAVGAEVASQFPDGVWLCELAPVDTDDAVLSAVGQVLGVVGAPNAALVAAIANHLAYRRMLLILDNCEHVIAAVAELADAILHASATSVMLVTSREPLGIDGESLIAVAPLAGGTRTSPAVRLFVERARSAARSFEPSDDDIVTIDAICRQLDGMPLAIELAAARIRSLSVTDIRLRLDHTLILLRGGRRGADRHRTLEAAIDWSYRQLDERDRIVFEGLSLFAGGCTLAAAEQIITADASNDMASSMDELIRKSLLIADVTASPTRYRLLEPLRQFARDRLHDGDRVAEAGTEPASDTLRSRHAAYYARVAAGARRQLSTRDGTTAVAVFEAEWDNLRIAVDWLASTGDFDGAADVVVNCFWWAVAGFHFDLASWAERVLGLPDARRHGRWPVAAAVTSVLRRGTGDIEGATALADEALAMAEARGTADQFEVLYAICLVYGRQDPVQADAVLRRLEQLAESGVDAIERGEARYLRTVMDIDNGRSGVVQLAQDGVRDAESGGNPYQLALAYTGLAAAMGAGDSRALLETYDRAKRYAQLAHHRLIAKNLGLWMAFSASSRSPREAVRFARETILGSFDDGYWGNFDLGLSAMLRAFVRLRIDSPAAFILGGLLGMTVQNPAVSEAIDVGRAALEAALGSDLPALLEQGLAASNHELARVALDEAAAVLSAAAETG